MNRREALKTTGIIFGSTVTGAGAFLSGCVNHKSAFDFTAADHRFLNHLGETILPRTNTPGAMDVNVASFMKVIVSDFYSAQEQKTFKDGIGYVNDLTASSLGKVFVDLAAEDRQNVLIRLEKEAADYHMQKKEGNHFYIMFKQLTVWGYLSAEIVARQAFIYAPLIEKFSGTIDYKPGDRVVYTDFGRSGSALGAATYSIKNDM